MILFVLLFLMAKKSFLGTIYSMYRPHFLTLFQSPVCKIRANPANHERDLAQEHNPETKEAFLTYISPI